MLNSLFSCGHATLLETMSISNDWVKEWKTSAWNTVLYECLCPYVCRVWMGVGCPYPAQSAAINAANQSTSLLVLLLVLSATLRVFCSLSVHKLWSEFAFLPLTHLDVCIDLCKWNLCNIKYTVLVRMWSYQRIHAFLTWTFSFKQNEISPSLMDFKWFHANWLKIA